jgi:hypothetical protein
MKNKLSFLTLLLAALILFSNCKKKDDDDTNSDSKPKTGDLQMKFSWHAKGSSDKADTNHCSISDIMNTVLSIAVSQDPVDVGQPDDLTWNIVYTASTPQYFTARIPSTVSLPLGTYKSIKIVQKNTVIWKCIHDSVTYEFESYNNTNYGADDIIPANYFFNDGSYYLDSLGYFRYGNAESVGDFEITENHTTRLDWRMNLEQLDWIDVDTNGVWNTGTDKLDNWKTFAGTTTMFDFIVTN